MVVEPTECLIADWLALSLWLDLCSYTWQQELTFSQRRKQVLRSPGPLGCSTWFLLTSNSWSFIRLQFLRTDFCIVQVFWHHCGDIKMFLEFLLQLWFENNRLKKCNFPFLHFTWDPFFQSSNLAGHVQGFCVFLGETKGLVTNRGRKTKTLIMAGNTNEMAKKHVKCKSGSTPQAPLIVFHDPHREASRLLSTSRWNDRPCCVVQKYKPEAT